MLENSNKYRKRLDWEEKPTISKGKQRLVRLVWLLVASIYSWAGIVLHDRLQQPALDVQAQIGMPLWHMGILSVLGILIALLWFLVKRFYSVKQTILTCQWELLILSAIAIAAGSLLMVNAVEHIHYVQYAILVFLLAHGLRSAEWAMIVAIGIGIVDEFYQFWILHPWQAYVDFNDLVFNTIGAVLGVILIRMKSIHTGKQTFPPPKRLVGNMWLFTGLLTIILFQLPSLSVYVSDSGVFLHRYAAPLSTDWTSRWIDTGWGNHWFMLSVWEAGLIVFVLPWIVLTQHWMRSVGIQTLGNSNSPVESLPSSGSEEIVGEL